MKKNSEDKNHEVDKVERAENIMINTIAETMDLYGVTPSVGRLYATLYFEHQPMTLDEMKDKLGMSKPSMSTAIRKLQDINIVNKVWEKGSRKNLFVAEKDYFQYFKKFFGNRLEREANMFLVSIDEALEQLSEVLENPKTEENLKKRAQLNYDQLIVAKEYYKWMEQLVKYIESGEIYKLLPENNQDK